jgi:Tfp pilus assembly protein PilX
MMSGKTKIRGIAIPTVLFIIVIILVIGVAISTTAIQNLRNARLNRWNKEAFYAAEAGLARAIDRIKTDNEWQGYNTSLGYKTLTFKDVAMESQAGDITATYTVYVCNNFDTTASPQPVPQEIAQHISSIPPECAYILSVGKITGQNVKKKVGTMMRKKEFHPFNSALFGDVKLDLGNVNVYAYDSTTGTYNKIPGKANVGVNGTGWTSGAVAIAKGAANVNGFLFLSTLVHGIPGIVSYGGNVTPDKVKATSPQPMPSVELPTGYTPQAIPSGNNIVLEPGNYTAGNKTLDLKAQNNVTLKIPAGTSPENAVFIFKGIDLHGGSNIKIQNESPYPVKVYVDGNIGGSGNPSLGFITGDSVIRPGNVQVYGTDNCKNVTLRGNPDAGFVAYVPKAKATISGNVSFFGSICAEEIQIHGHAADVYYDISLDKISIPGTPVISATSWQRF